MSRILKCLKCFYCIEKTMLCGHPEAKIARTKKTQVTQKSCITMAREDCGGEAKLFEEA